MADRIKIFAITTKDNPYDPFDDFVNWYRFDNEKGYCTSEYIDRLALTSDQLSDLENQEELERVIDDIIACDPYGIYVKLEKEVPVTSLITD